MPSPLIGLTTRNNSDPELKHPIITCPRSYNQALIRAGAIPLMIPVNLDTSLLPELLNRLDGIILTGGGDISLDYFDGEDHQKIYDVDPERDALEIELARLVGALEIPFMGICRGFQVLTVAYGGDLYTHIEDQLPGAVQHAYIKTHPHDYLAHRIKLKPGSLLANIYQQEYVMVNSLHHQGARSIPEPLEAVGWAPDGLIEAVILRGHPFGMGVQWHPEWMPEDIHQQKVFTSLIEAARNYRTSKGVQ